MPFSYYVGLDLGQARDFSALALLEEPVWVPSEELNYPGWAARLNIHRAGWVSPSSLTHYQLEQALSVNHHYGRAPHPPMSLRHLERFELGTRYPVVIDKVSRLLSSAPLKGKRVAFLVDKTGVGASVVDSFAFAGLSPIAISIHGGSTVSMEQDVWGYRVPKRDLVSAVQVLLQNGRLKIAEGLPLAETLKKELLNFRAKINIATGHDSYEAWREADHDDLVLATSMAVWFRQWFSSNVDAANAGVVAM
jgi:hypothetical protein